MAKDYRIKRNIIWTATFIIIMIGMVFYKNDERRPTKSQQAIDACIAQGGVPTIDGWHNTMKDCVFPPENNR
jgi:hypothetical protein